MKVCMIGLGSIGCRHIKNLHKILNERKIEFIIDALRSNSRELDKEIKGLLHNEYFTVEDLPNDYDIMIIANPTYLHYRTLEHIKNKTRHVFLEKPIFEHCGYDIGKLNIPRENVYYVACPLRYTPVLTYVKDLISKEKVYSVRAISSSYLPEWRKNVDYRKVYSSQKALGGGVSLDLIHEWDYLIYLFGLPNNVRKWSGTYSELELNSDDLAVYIAQYNDKLIELHLDYFGRKTTRKLELYCKDYLVEADIVEHTITYRGNVDKVITFEKEDFYINEMNYFLDIILKNRSNTNNLFHAYQTLKVAIPEKEG